MSITFKHEKITVRVINRKLPFPECMKEKVVDGMVGEGTGYAYHQPLGVIKKRYPDVWMVCILSRGTTAVTNPLPANPQTAEMLIEALHEIREEIETSHFPSENGNQIAREMQDKGQDKWVTLKSKVS